MAKKKKDQIGSNTNAAILDYVERYEQLTEQKVALNEDFKTLAQQIKSEGFDAAIVKEIVRIRNNEAKWKERYQLVSTYAAACQLSLFDEPLSEAA